jgi:hypothetical protein
VIITAPDWDTFVYVAHLLGESEVVGTPLGGNQIDVPDGADLSDDVRAELARYTDFDGSPPVAGEGRAPRVGNQPLSPAPLSLSADGGPVPLPRPPRVGPGSSRQAWARYAAQQNPPVTVTAAMSRDQIVRAVDAQEAQSA